MADCKFTGHEEVDRLFVEADRRRLYQRVNVGVGVIRTLRTHRLGGSYSGP